MGFKIKNKNTDSDRYLTITESDNLNFLFFRDNYEYVSYFPFACYNPMIEDDAKFIGYIGALQSNDIDDDSFSDSLPHNIDLYVCKNGMKTQFSRRSDNLINIQNLVIDLDYHSNTLNINELNKHIDIIINVLLGKLTIKPNLINKTGRGIHLWYCIEPAHIKLKKICWSVVEMLCEEIESILNELSEDILKVDRKASSTLNGIIRVPYSYNTKADRWSEAELINGEILNVIDICKILRDAGFKSEYIPDENEKKKKTKKRKFSRKKLSELKSSKTNYTPCLMHRKLFMEYLFDTRDLSGNGFRDLMIFGMYSTVSKLMEIEDAQNYCLELNQRFEIPLRYGEISCIFKEVDKKKYNNITVKGFFKLINATPDEINWFNTHTVKEVRKQEKRDKKIDRNNQIKLLYEQGNSITNISKELNLSRTTIYKVINS